MKIKQINQKDQAKTSDDQQAKTSEDQSPKIQQLQYDEILKLKDIKMEQMNKFIN